jgi:hypothetical protein
MESVKDLLSNEEFDDLLMMHVEFVRGIVEEEGINSYFPEIFVFEPNGKVQIIRLCFDDERYKIVRQAGAVCYQKRIIPVAIIMASEAWVREQRADQPFSSRPISSYADKEEIISIAGMTLDGRANGAMLWFSRRKDDSIILTKDKFKIVTCDDKEGATMKGDLLPQFFQGYCEEFLKERN